MSVPAELNEASVGEADADDALRRLVSSMLSGTFKEELYLWHVSELCRDEPESAPKLLGLIDRYYRLGRMPAVQYQKLKARLEQAMGTRPAADEVNFDSAAEDDIDSDDSVTRELTPAQAPATRQMHAVPSAAAPEQTPAWHAPPAADQTQAWLGPAPASAAVEAHAVPQAKLAANASTLTEELPTSRTPAAAHGSSTAPAPDAAAASGAAHAASSAGAAVAERAAAERALAAKREVAAERAAASVRSGAAATARTAAPAPVSIGIGTILRDRYELLLLLGRGGMASVFKARDRYRASLGVADCNVAIKIVQPHPSRPGSVDALGREFHNAQRLSHPNVVNVYDIDHEGDASFYSMEFLEGERLSQLLKRAGGRLPRRYALAIIRDIGIAIAHAHSRGVVHADLKPHNIMITRDGHVRVLDFGSGIVRPGEPWIAELSPGGDYRQATPAYASCEQLQGWCADPRDDIYALACLAYQLLAGKHPFDERSSLVARGRRMRPRRPAGMRGDNWRALRRGLAWSREQRNMTMEKWLEQLGVSEAAETLPPLARLAAAPPPRQWPQWLAAGVVVLFSLGLAAFAIQRQASVDWQQAFAQVQSTWNATWQQLRPSANAPTPAAPASSDAAVAPLTPLASNLVAAAAAAPADPLRPVAPAADPAAPARLASIRGRSAAIVTAEDAYPAAARSGSPRVEFAASSYQVAGGDPAARIVVRRLGSLDGDVSFTWWTEAASAQPDVDYASLGRRVERIASGEDKITVFVPIISNPQRARPSQFYVALGDSVSARTGAANTRATVSIDRGD